MTNGLVVYPKMISIHPLRGEWDCIQDDDVDKDDISIHPLRGEWDWHGVWKTTYRSRFQSTHSVGSGTYKKISYDNLPEISIHPLRGEWDGVKNNTAVGYLAISIHPLRGEWDLRVRYAYADG